MRLITPSLVWRGPPLALPVWLNFISEAYKCMHRCLGLDQAVTVAHSGRGKGRVFAAAVRTWLHNDHRFEMRKKKKIRFLWIFKDVSEWLILGRISAFITISVSSLSLLPAPWRLSCVGSTPAVPVLERKIYLRLNFIYPIPCCHLLPDCINCWEGACFCSVAGFPQSTGFNDSKTSACFVIMFSYLYPRLLPV